MMAFAASIWSLKNSPKFFMYILALTASTTATALFKVQSKSPALSATAFITSESLPTPEGSIMILSGAYFVITSLRLEPKSPTSEQHIQPEFISLISIPESLRNAPSIPISPYSFSISTIFSLFKPSDRSFLMSVVLPAPKNPDTISIFVIFKSFPFLELSFLLYLNVADVIKLPLVL